MQFSYLLMQKLLGMVKRSKILSQTINMYNSHGIIAFNKTSTAAYQGAKFLVIQRRDTLAFIQLLRFSNKLSDEEICQKISRITPKEAKRLLSHTFEELWEDLFIDKSNRTYITERNKARNNYKLLLEKYKSEIELPKNNDLEWGIPKGRRKRKESGFDCSVREWQEETGFDVSKIQLINTRPFFYNLDYGFRAVCVECWLARSEEILEPIYKKTKIRSFISEEVGDVKWISTKEMRFLPSEIQEVLLEVEEFIDNNL